MQDIRVIAPNLKKRLSGVTATIARLVPLQAKSINIVATGPGLPAETPHVSLAQVLRMPRRPLRVWHARRNTEMLLGLFLKHVLRKNLALLFTSASQREHTGYTRWLINRMDRVVVVSTKGRAYLKVPSTVIYHGIDTERFSPASDKGALRRELGLPADGLLAGCYGRIRHQKGTDVFVHALMEIAKDDGTVSAIAMGRATEKHVGFLEGLKGEVAAAGLSEQILFPPEVSVHEIARWYQVLDVFVAPQRWEGFGLTPLEAMACGVPVVATPVGAFEELVVPGKTGEIVPVGDTHAMAGAIRNLLADEAGRKEAAAASRQHVIENFSIEREAAALVQVYEEMLSEGAP